MDYFIETYNVSLVILSFAVAALASLTALDLADRVRSSQGRATLCWLSGGAIAMGTGIWAMHFIGMLAMDTAEHTGYDVGLTVLSLVLAVLTSALALFIVKTGRLGWRRLSAGSVIMGAGGSLMHYVGMMAMITTEPIEYRPELFLASIAIAISASGLSLWLTCALRHSSDHPRSWQRLLAASIMAVGISGMHYTGMAAAIMPNSIMMHAPDGISAVQMSIAIAAIAVCMLLAAMMMSIYDSHSRSRNARLARSLHEANLELRDRVHRDPLTRLPNRLMFEKRLETLLPRTDGLAVLFINLDRFKSVNDTFGHHIGDATLRAVATRLQAILASDDTVARGGGDEFMVIVAGDTRLQTYQARAQQLLGALGAPFDVENNVITFSSSIGISLYPDQAADPHSLMVYADTAMNKARAAGGNQVRLFEPAMSSQSDRRATLERRLRLALETDDLSLAYQPKVDVNTGTIMGVEALLRWNDDALGQVAPDEIVAVAETTGLILPLGEWVLRTACACFSAGPLFEQPLSVAVNVSALQIEDRQFTRTITRILNETGLPPERLELELTESALVHNPDLALSTLSELRALGLSLAIDDFGTGYSNLVQLRYFPIQTLKIDSTFMKGVTTTAQAAAIVEAVMALAHALGVHTVAEGIETSEQLDFIKGLGVHLYQGYLCSQPLGRTELLDVLSAAPSDSDRRNTSAARRS